MPSLGGPEIIVIVLAIVLLFGWKKLPEAARSIGQSMRVFKKEIDVMKSEGKDDERPAAPLTDRTPTTAAPDATAAPAPRAGETPSEGPGTTR